MRHCDRDRGALAIPGIVKIAIAIAVLGLLGYDGFVTVATHLKAENDAQNAAYAASAKWEGATGNAKDAQTAYAGALAYLMTNESGSCATALTAESQGTTPTSLPVGCDYLCTGAAAQVPVCGSHGLFSVDPDGTVHLVVRRQAKTLIFGHLGFMHNLLVAYEQGDANQSQD
jgi:hypothetical protein